MSYAISRRTPLCLADALRAALGPVAAEVRERLVRAVETLAG